MISLIIKSYLAILICITLASITVFFIGLYYIFKPGKKEKPIETLMHPQALSPPHASDIDSHDINAIAGDDVMSTQLDLARAYLETGNPSLAKKILDYVIEHGSQSQQDEARMLSGVL